MRFMSFTLSLIVSLAGLTITPLAHALFDDDEARRALLDLRKEVRERDDQRGREMVQRFDTVNRTQVDLLNQIDNLKQEISRLRGQLEVATKDLSDTQRKQKDLYTELDSRLKKIEPQTLSLEGRDITVEPNDKRLYDAALEQYRVADYKSAVQSLSSLLKQSPKSELIPSAQFYLGSAYFALKDWRASIAQLQNLVKNAPSYARAPDALLIIASNQAELNDRKGMRATLERIEREYPESNAAKTAKEKLAQIR